MFLHRCKRLLQKGNPPKISKKNKNIKIKAMHIDTAASFTKIVLKFLFHLQASQANESLKMSVLTLKGNSLEIMKFNRQKCHAA